MKLRLFHFVGCASSHAVPRRLPLILLIAALVCLAGCSGKGKIKNKVTGKVTLDGEPVAGTVSLIGEDGKEAPVSGLLEEGGTYTILNPPLGKYEVIVKAPLGGGNPGQPPPNAAGTGGGVSANKVEGPKGKMPPKKYERPKNGLPQLEVTGGEQTHDIALTK